MLSPKVLGLGGGGNDSVSLLDQGILTLGAAPGLEI